MRIKRLEIHGFKSFADRAVLNFGTGITGVVGPNGCGKSNIIDSIRWCMGEMSAKHLRGRAMQDVIFAGSDTRGPLGMAEVTLTFNNDGNVPPQYADYGEISVTRRLHRDGTSEYLINKVTVRLRDIVDLFLGTGVGTRAYSIIEQGRVGFIVSSKPEQRRTLIEEVAGITKFKVRKKAAERRMKSTEQNLLRVNDIINELERQLGSLKRQAQKAERYKRLRNELRDIDLHMASIRILELMSEHKVNEAQLKVLSEEVQSGDAHVASLEANLEVDKMRLLEEESQLQVHQQRSAEADTQLVGLERDLNHWRDQVAEVTQRIEDAAGDSEEARVSLLEIREELVRLREQIETLASTASEDAESTERAEENVSQAQRALAEVNGRIEAFRRDALDKVHGSAQQRTQLAGLEKQRVGITQRLESAREEKRSVEVNHLQAHEHLAELSESHSTLATQTGDWKERHRLLQEQLETVTLSVNETSDQLFRLRGEFSQKESRLSSLEEIAQRLEGFPEGVRALLGKSDNADLPAIPQVVASGVLGTVADTIRVPKEYERAFESAMGAALQYLVVEKQDVGFAALEYLRAADAGRSGFIPQRLLAEAPTELPTVSGTLGRAMDVVQVEPSSEGIARLLLNNVYLVESVEQARTLIEADAFSGTPEAVLVTLDGDRVECRGGVAGGAVSDGGVFAKQREIRELHTQVERLDGAIEQCVAQQEELEHQRAQLDAESRQLDKDIRQSDITLVKLTKDVEGAEKDVSRFQERAEVLTYEVGQREEELEAIERESVSARAAAEEAEAGQEEIEAQIETLQQTRTELAERLDEATEIQTVLRVQISGRDEKLAAMRQGLKRSEFTETELEQRIERNERVSGEGSDLVIDLREKITEGQASSETVVLQAQELREQLSTMRAAYEENRSKISEVENSLREQRKGGQSRQEKLNQCRLTLQRIEMDRVRIIDQIEERYDLHILSVLSDYHALGMPGEEKVAQKEDLERKIKNMGSINLTAIEECAEVEERHEFLTEQRQDLKDALDSLRRAINRINRVSRERFEVAFHSVNDMFQKVFPRLFRGGEARLELVDSDDMLEAGVDIIAMPPGKKLQNVGLLSGGEKALTATALIFSIFLIKPSPFCVLDEVDAPLDEANVGRFNEMLREISKVSQFIVITHNKNTMTSVDRLYGITMEEPGMSKVVSVNLEAASRFRAA